MGCRQVTVFVFVGRCLTAAIDAEVLMLDKYAVVQSQRGLFLLRAQQLGRERADRLQCAQRA